MNRMHEAKQGSKCSFAGSTAAFACGYSSGGSIADSQDKAIDYGVARRINPMRPCKRRS